MCKKIASLSKKKEKLTGNRRGGEKEKGKIGVGGKVKDLRKI